MDQRREAQAPPLQREKTTGVFFRYGQVAKAAVSVTAGAGGPG